jgi:hypothetical protein
LTKEEREKYIKLKKLARDKENWKVCKALRVKIFEYDRNHPKEPSLALEVAQKSR